MIFKWKTQKDKERELQALKNEETIKQTVNDHLKVLWLVLNKRKEKSITVKKDEFLELNLSPKKVSFKRDDDEWTFKAE